MRIAPDLAEPAVDDESAATWPLTNTATPTEPTGEALATCVRATARLFVEGGHQTATLTWKCLITIWRRKAWTLAFTIMPLLTALALGAASEALARQVIPPKDGIALNLDRCSAFNVYGQIGTMDCTTVGFAPTSAAATEIMKRVASDLGFSRGEKVGEFDVVEFSTVSAMSRALLKRPGQIEMAISFTDLKPSSNSFEYELWYNRTALATSAKLRLDALGGYYKVAGRSLALQQAVDAAIVGYAGGASASANFEATVDTFPHKMAANLMNVLGEASIIPWLGSTLTVIGFAVQALMVIGLVIGEKESGVLFTVRRMGLIELY